MGVVLLEMAIEIKLGKPDERCLWGGVLSRGVVVDLVVEAISMMQLFYCCVI